MAEERNLGVARAFDEDEGYTKAELQRRMEEARESITQTVTEIKDTVVDQYQSARESMSEALDWREQVRERPVVWSASALGVGIVVGYGLAGILSEGTYFSSWRDDDRTQGRAITSSTPSPSYSPSIGGDTSEQGKDSQPEPIERFEGTPVFDHLQSEVSSIGNRLVEEVAIVAIAVVLPTIFSKIKEYFGIKLSNNISERDIEKQPPVKDNASSATSFYQEEGYETAENRTSSVNTKGIPSEPSSSESRIETIVSFKTIDLIFSIDKELKKSFPETQILAEEIEGVVQGLVNTVKWSVLRSAIEQAHGGLLGSGVGIVETSDSFSSSWMNREEILNRIENTSGLPEEISSEALKIIESIVAAVVAQGSVLEIEHIGQIRARKGGGYSIDLAKELQILSGTTAAVSISEPEVERVSEGENEQSMSAGTST